MDDIVVSNRHKNPYAQKISINILNAIYQALKLMISKPKGNFALTH